MKFFMTRVFLVKIVTTTLQPSQNRSSTSERIIKHANLVHIMTEVTANSIEVVNFDTLARNVKVMDTVKDQTAIKDTPYHANLVLSVYLERDAHLTTRCLRIQQMMKMSMLRISRRKE